MAVIQLGKGKRYVKSRVNVGGYISGGSEPPSALVIKCTTPKGKDQKNFPVWVTLDHDELLELVSSICAELIKRKP
jgi:hypothetical protein